MKQPVGFTRDFGGREAPCIGVFGGEGTGKTRLCATAGQYAAERGETPAWLVCDRKTRKTVRAVCEELGLDLPLINDKDFIWEEEAAQIAKLDRDTENGQVIKIYTAVYKRLLDAAISLVRVPEINPIIFETGTQIWDWISFAHFGRKQDVGKSRVWGPPKQDWTDLMDALSSKTVLISFWERDEYRNDARTGTTKPDGPPHVGYTTTTLVRLNQDRQRKIRAEDGETYVDRFTLDVYESQDNKALEGQFGVLAGEDINYAGLLSVLGYTL